MSELKAISGNEIREDIDYNTRGVDPEDKEWRNYGKELCDILYYRKSEADKVIEERDEKIDELKERIDELQKATDSAWSKVNAMYDELRHQKYKQCLKWAKWCRLEQERIELIECQYITDDDFNKLAKGFYKKWHKRWLKIAEQFKEAK